MCSKYALPHLKKSSRGKYSDSPLATLRLNFKTVFLLSTYP